MRAWFSVFQFYISFSPFFVSPFFPSTKQGYSDKLDSLLYKVLESFVAFEFRDEELLVARERIMRRLANVEKDQVRGKVESESESESFECESERREGRRSCWWRAQGFNAHNKYSDTL
jgi:hypothetical protein